VPNNYNQNTQNNSNNIVVNDSNNTSLAAGTPVLKNSEWEERERKRGGRAGLRISLSGNRLGWQQGFISGFFFFVYYFFKKILKKFWVVPCFKRSLG